MIGYASLHDFHMTSTSLRLRKLLVRQIVRAAIGVGLLFLFVGFFAVLQLGPASIAVGTLTCFLSTAIAAGCLRAARRQRAMLVLSYCEQGARLAAPLPDFLRAIAMNETRRTSRRLISIAEMLEAPTSLGSAIESELPELPLRFGEVLRAAESSGTLTPTLARLMRDAVPPTVDRSSRGPMSGAYIAITLPALGLPAFLLLIFVLPKLAQIYRDFGMPMPTLWATVMTLSPTAFYAVSGTFVAVTVLVILTTLANNARWIFFRRHEYDRPLKPLIDRALFHLPIVGSAIRDRDWADVCQTLADGIAMHRPLDVMLREAAAQRHLNSVTATRIDSWLGRIVRGETLSKAARLSLVPGVVCGMIGEARGDSLAPAFAFLARHYRGRGAQRGAWLAAAAIPVMTLMCGAIVAVFATSLWLPMTRLIDATNPYPMGL